MLIVIIGLPASGKTTFFKEGIKEGYELYDDFISNFFDGELMERIKEKRNLCIIDPRLCDYEIFRKVMNEIERYVKIDDIKLILFENNPEKSLENAKKRINKNVIRTIEKYSKIYDLNNYMDYNHEIINF